jgi:hypothetical protein
MSVELRDRENLFAYSVEIMIMVRYRQKRNVKFSFLPWYEPDVMFPALLHDGLADVGSQVVPNQNLDILLGDAALDEFEEHLLKEGFELPHIKPAALVGCKHASRRGTCRPGVVKVPAEAFQHCHGGCKVTFPTGTEHGTEGSLTVILHLFRVPDTFFEKALFCPRIIAHARLVIVEDVGWWHALNFFLQIFKILSDAVVNILAKFQITVPSLLVFTWYSVPYLYIRYWYQGIYCATLYWYHWS